MRTRRNHQVLAHELLKQLSLLGRHLVVLPETDALYLSRAILLIQVLRAVFVLI